MSFGKIWKKQVQVPKGGVSFWKPKTEIKLVQDNDEDCCKKAKEEWLIELKKYYRLPDLKQGIYQMDCLEFKRLLNLFVADDDNEREYLKIPANKVLNKWEECEKNVQ